jgi:hypothetical protein
MRGFGLILISWSSGRVINDHGAFVVELPAGESRTVASLGDALIEVMEVDEDYGGRIEYGVKRESVWAAADEVSVDAFLPWSQDGWAKCDRRWIPASFHPDYDGPATHHKPVYVSGSLGCFAEVFAWEDVVLLSWQGPEGSDHGWEFLGITSLADAMARADSVATEMLIDWNLNFSPFIGLDNLELADQFRVPRDASRWRTYTSCLTYDGSEVATVDVYRWIGPEGERFLVADGRTVVGQYNSAGALEKAIDEDGLHVDFD